MSDELLSGTLPPIVRDANRLLLAVESCVRNFARYHKYQVGADLRRQAMQLARLAQRAWRDRAHQAEYLARLLWAVDEFKLTLQLAKSIQAFASWAQFEACAQLALQLGKQAGGWSRRLATSRADFAPPSNHGQKPRAAGATHPGAAARPDSLSPRATGAAPPGAREVKA